MTEIERRRVLKAIAKELKKYEIAGVATDTGLSYPTIRDIKNGATITPNDSTVTALANYFEIEVA